jgi:hypothetical protein
MRSVDTISGDLGEPKELIVPASAKDASIPISDLWERIEAKL